MEKFGHEDLNVLSMDNETKCYKCVNFKVKVGHETKWCPKNICKKCGQNGHTKIDCMVDFKNFPLPKEVLRGIYSNLNHKDQNQWSKVCCIISRHQLCSPRVLWSASEQSKSNKCHQDNLDHLSPS